MFLFIKKSKVQIKLSHRQELLFDKLKLFYNSDNISKLLPIINGETKLSLRIIDWFVTNKNKKNNIILYNKKRKIVTTKSPKSKLDSKTKKTKYEYVDEQFNIFLNYKGQLKAYSKKNFDPFCRRERINFYYNNDKYITTTVGQLNFFKWAIQNKIINYIVTNYDKIEKDMTESLNGKYVKKKGSKRKKRKELSISATKTVKKHDVSIVVNFD